MLWIVLVIIVAISSALIAFTDNYIADVCFKGRLPQAYKVMGGFTYSILTIIIAIIFPPIAIPAIAALMFVLSGILSSLNSIPYFNALSSENTTSTAIFIQLTPIIYLIAGWALLGDNITPLQIIAFLVILIAPIIVIASSPKRNKKRQLKSSLFLIAYVVLAAASNLIFLLYLDEVPFMTAFFCYCLGKALSDGMLTLAFKRYRIRFKQALKGQSFRVIFTVLIDQVFSLGTDLTYRVALSLAPVAIVSVSANALQLIATFILGIILTILWPNFGREKLTKKMVTAHFFATAVAVVGIILLQ